MEKQELKKNGDESGAAYTKLLDLEIKRLLNHDGWKVDAFCDANPKAVSDPTEIMVRAARDGNLEIVDAALAAGADINGRSCQGMHTALTAAVTSKSFCLHYENRTIDFVREILKKGADVNMAGPDGRTPLIEVCGLWQIPLDVVKWLLDHGADPNLTCNKGRTCIMEAIFSLDFEFRETLKLLVECGADVNATDHDGNSALHFAVLGRETPYGFMAGHEKDPGLASVLMEYGASPNIRNNDGDTPLMLAAKFDSTKLVKLLLGNGATPWIMDNEDKLPVEVGQSKVVRRAIASRMRRFLHRIEDRCEPAEPSSISSPSPGGSAGLDPATVPSERTFYGTFDEIDSVDFSNS